MTTAGFYEDLAPFVSLTLAKAVRVRHEDQLDRCLGDIEAICARESSPSTSDFTKFPEFSAGGVRTRAMRYQRVVRPAWTKNPAIVDRQHHLVLAISRKGYVALHITDPKLKGPVRAALIGEAEEEAPLTWLSPVSRAIMAAAFLNDGQAKTLWLSGVHRRSATRADAKILAGQDLDYSLDPFEDQSFYWSAARSRSATLDITVGVSPKASRVWMGKAETIVQFATASAALIDAVAGARSSGEEPFRFLAVPMETVDPAAVRKAYDLSLLPPDMREDADEDADTANADAALILEANMIAENAGGSDVRLGVEFNGARIGSLALTVEIARDGRVKYKVEISEAVDRADDRLKRLTVLLKAGAGVNIRYDSGHSISDRQVYQLRVPRIAFDHFEPRDFGRSNIKKEKPDDMANIGGEDSLFCWVKNTHGGWLACDDGANEKADFIHLDVGGAKPVLSLIHVKGAKSNSAARGLSVAAYEVVTAQAIKNLQWLDKQALATGLERAVRATNYWWKDGQPVSKDELVAAIAALGDDFIRRVVIVQPHVTEAARQSAEAALGGVKRLRLDQLNTLLASAWRAANGLGAEFRAIWSK